MKVVKTSAIALAVSAMLAGPVLAQGVSSDTRIRGGMQGKSQMQGGSSSDDEELNAQPDAGTAKAGGHAKTKGTVGAGGGMSKSTGGADSTTGSKRPQ
jgi:hypothetical protein